MRKPLALAIWFRATSWTIPAAVLLMAAFLAPGTAGAQGGGAQGGRGPVSLIRDAETESLIRAFLDPLLAAAGVDRRLVELTLVQDRAINAFVAQGNRLYLHTGLIQQAESAGELAGVIAHEVGHIAGGHLARLPEEMRLAMLRSVAAMLLGAGAGVAARSSDAAMGIIMGGQTSAMGAFFAFTRTQEQSADQAGLVLLERLGWSSQGLERLLRRLLDQELLAVGRQDPYFRTHPLSRDRLEFVREQMARGRATSGGIPAALETRFAMVRAKLNGFVDAPVASWRRYLNDDSAPGRYARSIAQYRSGRTDAAIEILEPVIREQPSNPYLLEFKGQILFEGGRPAEAIAPLAAATRLAPNEPLIRAAYGRALMEGGGDTASVRRAVAELQAAARQDRENGFTWGQLATAYARLDDLPNAELALAEQAMAQGNTAEARFRAARAERGLPPGPARLRATDLRNAVRRDNLTSDERRAEDELRRRDRNNR
ncbi:Putative Zn-dependent protease, contains TPR repeats [Roseomonas rosea]|uniref:Putative Zn-dependent protease, contains TPR repeats n=1 Tax=Muricoccus roseus TaxID=198092 RepID=A0A1M6AN99_9PROT|nr:M48 family metalloprotease [Roseomonas rosea]SHI37984.1 Putative Zn-dependent protease, contains TPR repeats [Roseomonas rosea]